MKSVLLLFMLFLAPYLGYSQAIGTSPRQTLPDIHANSRVGNPRRSGNVHPMMTRHFRHPGNRHGMKGRHKGARHHRAVRRSGIRRRMLR